MVDKALRTTRVAVDLGRPRSQYVKDMQLVDMPDRLFQQLVRKPSAGRPTASSSTPASRTLDPGLLVTGQLSSSAMMRTAGQVVVQYDAALSTEGGRQVESRRFTATAPADGTANRPAQRSTTPPTRSPPEVAQLDRRLGDG